MKDWDKEEVKMASKIARLESERNELAGRLTVVEMSLIHQREGWRKEREKTAALTYSEQITALADVFIAPDYDYFIM